MLASPILSTNQNRSWIEFQCSVIDKDWTVETLINKWINNDSFINLFLIGAPPVV